MADLELWALMQRVETLRYRAERVERIFAGMPERYRPHGDGLAAHLRQMAEQVYALSKGEAIAPVPPPAAAACVSRLSPEPEPVAVAA